MDRLVQLAHQSTPEEGTTSPPAPPAKPATATPARTPRLTATPAWATKCCSGPRNSWLAAAGTLKPLLDQVGDLRDTVITVDTLHCRRDHVTYLAERGADCILTVK